MLDEDIGPSALVMPQPVNAEGLLLRMVSAQAVRTGLISQEEADGALASVRSAAEEGVAFSAVTMFGFVARKP